MAIRNRAGNRRRATALTRLAAAIVTALLAIGIAAGHARAQDYAVDTQLSDGLTTELRSHLLPLVGAQVGKNPAGARRVVLYGYVATEKGKSDAEKRTLAYLGSPPPEIVDHIVIQPEIAKLRPHRDATGGPALGTASDYAGSSGGALQGETFDQVYRQIQSYGVHPIPGDSGYGGP